MNDGASLIQNVIGVGDYGPSVTGWTFAPWYYSATLSWTGATVKGIDTLNLSFLSGVACY